MFDAFVVAARVGAVPGAGFTFFNIGAAVVAAARAVAVFGARDTSANGGVAGGGWACAVAVFSAGAASTAQTERGDDSELTGTATVSTEGGGVGAGLVGEGIALQTGRCDLQEFS